MKKKSGMAMAMVIGAVVGKIGSDIISQKKIDEKAEKADKFKRYYGMLNQWLILKQEGRSIVQYFEHKQYKKIAIYGVGEMGNRLYEELRGSGIEIAYAIDKNQTDTYWNVEVVKEDAKLERVDAIIVTAIFAYDEIEEEMISKTESPIISLEDIIYES